MMKKWFVIVLPILAVFLVGVYFSYERIFAIASGTDSQATGTLTTYNDQTDSYPVFVFQKSHSDTEGTMVETPTGTVPGAFIFQGVSENGGWANVAAVLSEIRDGGSGDNLAGKVTMYAMYGDGTAFQYVYDTDGSFKIDASGVAGIDPALILEGEDSNTSVTWMEDEAYLLYEDDVVYEMLDDDAADAASITLRTADTGPAGIHQDDYLGSLLFQGYGQSAYQTGAEIRAVAMEDFTDANFGTQLDFYVADTIGSSLNKFMSLGFIYGSTSNRRLAFSDGRIEFDQSMNSANMFWFRSRAHLFSIDGDKNVGDLVTIKSEDENSSFTDSNDEMSWLAIYGDIEMSATGAYNGILIQMDEDSVGDGSTGSCGDNTFICAGTVTDPDKFFVDHDGGITTTTGTVTTKIGSAWDFGAYNAGAPTADGYLVVVVDGTTYHIACDAQ